MAAAQQPNQSDNSLAPLWIVVALFAVCIFVWYMWHGFFAAVFIKIQLAQIALISLFTDSIEPVRQQALEIAPASMTFSDLMNLSTEVGKYLRWPVGILFVLLGIIIFKAKASARFKRTYTMKTLHAQELNNWPQTRAIEKLDLVNEHVEKGKWAMAPTPMQFAKKYKLVKEEVEEVDTGLKRDLKPVVRVIPARANKIFSRQMGRTWRGVKYLPVHRRALFAIFAAKGSHDDEAARKLLNKIAESAGGKLDFSGADDLLKKFIDEKKIKKIMHTHAYELTIMASMLSYAREDGVLATAEFLWLKPLDRGLWFMLNAVGRKTPTTEAAGPFAHWLAEKALQRKLTVPMIGEATEALDDAIKNILYEPDED